MVCGIGIVDCSLIISDLALILDVVAESVATSYDA